MAGNALDLYLRNGQDGQTMGVPIGPDTSFVIAELIMSSVDQALLRKHPRLTGFRFYDDYEIVCESESDAQKILADLEDCVSEYELSLNRRKTRIVKLPDVIDHSWVSALKSFELPKYASEVEEKLIDFANLIFPLANKFPHDPVLRYALVKLATGSVDEDLIVEGVIDRADLYSPFAASDVYQQLLIQIYRTEPHLSHIIAREFLRCEEDGREIKKDLIREAISSHIMRYSASKANNEVAWALWLAIQFEIKLNASIVRRIGTIDDNFVAILALDARAKGLFRSNLDTGLWETAMKETEIYSENWLLCYEAAVKNWLPLADASNYINTHQSYGTFSQYDISFYDSHSYNDKARTLEDLEIDTDFYST